METLSEWMKTLSEWMKRYIEWSKTLLKWSKNHSEWMKSPLQFEGEAQKDLYFLNPLEKPHPMRNAVLTFNYINCRSFTSFAIRA